MPVNLKSGRAAHIGVTAANHALRRGLGVCLGGGCAGAIIELGYGLRSTPPEPRFGTDGQLRQCLSNVIDRVERVEGAGTGESDFVNSGGNRRLDIVIASGTGIPFPFAPSGDHCGPFAARRPLSSGLNSPSGSVGLCCNLKALLGKIVSKTVTDSTLPRISRKVMINGGKSTGNCRKCGNPLALR